MSGFRSFSATVTRVRSGSELTPRQAFLSQTGFYS